MFLTTGRTPETRRGGVPGPRRVSEAATVVHGMDLEQPSGGGIMVLTGEPDAGRTAAWCARVSALHADGHRAIGCDVRGLSGCASAVLQALARIALTARRSGCRCVLIGADDRLLILLELTGLNELFDTATPEW
ncbi:STAS domain-containing protein [Nocardia tengchongensis]|uniref:STAS domain-containing protein n=2 Tax=Nocardia tengchongensis TaxID=2055889 RepID=UPI00368316CB